MSKAKGLIAVGIAAALGGVVYKVYNQRKLDLTLAQLVYEGATLDRIAPVLRRGANPNARFARLVAGRHWVVEPVLLIAYERERIDVFKALLEKCADPNATASTGRTILATAASSNLKNSRLAVRWLLDKGADANAYDGVYGTALIAAASSYGLENAKLLLEKGADVNARDRWHRTALMLAAEGGDVEMVKLLLKAGADTSLQDYQRKTALDYAKENNCYKVVKFLSK